MDKIDSQFIISEQPMQCFIYKSPKKDELYLYLDKHDDFSKVPELLFKSMGEPIFVMELELTPQRMLAREDAQHVIRQLQEKGYFVQMPPPTNLLAPAKLQ